MGVENLLLIIALIFGFYAAWSIGANDVANAMGTSVGSKALTLKQAVILAAIFEFLGAVLFGSTVSATLEGKIVEETLFSDQPLFLVIGMLAALLSTGLWLHFASHFGLPVSTTHAIVGSIVGFGAICGGVHAVNWKEVGFIAMSWILSPLLGGSLSFLIFLILRREIFYKTHPLQAVKKSLPILVGSVAFVLSLITFDKAILTHAPLWLNAIFALTLAFILGYSSSHIVRKFGPHLPIEPVKSTNPQLEKQLQEVKDYLAKVQLATTGETAYRVQDIMQEVDLLTSSLEEANCDKEKTEFFWVEKIFGYLQVSSACLMAFAHGSNDVSNAIGPLAAIINELAPSWQTAGTIPTWILVLGGVGIVLGLATFGWRVIETIGRKITELTPSRGFSAEFGAACIILLASYMGIPISTTHTLVGSVFGVGFAGGIGALNVKTIRNVLFSWIITIPIAALLSGACYYLLAIIFNSSIA